MAYMGPMQRWAVSWGSFPAGALRPFFPFYGSKWRDARRYPAPTGLVVEPFAGSAGYSTWYAPRSVVLVDLDPVLFGVWDYLIRVGEAEVLALPDVAVGESIGDHRELPQEARWLIGFWLNRGSSSPKLVRTEFSSRSERSPLGWGADARRRIASQVGKIRHWRVIHGSYSDLAVQYMGGSEVTWFVDPPYEVKGQHYRHHEVDYAVLGAWCRGLPGQTVVCEQVGAAWLPFEPLATTKSTRGTSAEAVWTRSDVPRLFRRDP